MGGRTVNRLFKNKQGERFVDIVTLVLAIVMVLALVIQVLPVFITKHNLDIFATELVRTAEITGSVGSATTDKANQLKQETGLSPSISWNQYGTIPLGDEVSVTLTTTVNIGLFGGFGSFPITLTAKATGTSEVYRK